MSLDTHRLLIIFIVLNLLIGFVQSIAQNPTITQQSKIEEYIGDTNNRLIEYREEFGKNESRTGETLKPSERQFQPTIGDSVRWGSIILDSFFLGMNAFSVQPETYTDATEIEKLAAFALGLLRSFLYVFIIVELYMLIFNKKST